MIDTNKEIRLLTLRQPFASLLFAEAPFRKEIETRTWATPYRGQILVSASKKPYSWDQVRDIAGAAQFERILQWSAGAGRNNQQYCGHAIGVLNLVNCRDMEYEDETGSLVDFSSDLFSWDVRDPRLIVPFPIVGSITFAPVPYEIKKLITASQLELFSENIIGSS